MKKQTTTAPERLANYRAQAAKNQAGANACQYCADFCAGRTLSPQGEQREFCYHHDSARIDWRAYRLPATYCSTAAGEPFNVGGSQCRYFPDFAACGFRLIGLSHDVAPRRVDHRGWYTRADGDSGETITGAVFLLPGRAGVSQLFAGYIEQGFGEDGAAVIDVKREDYTSRGEDVRESDEINDTAGAADRLAEIAAENMREHDSAWQAGARYAANRQEIFAALAEIRAYQTSARKLDACRPVLTPAREDETALDAIRECMERRRETVDSLKKENAELKAGDNSDFYFYANDPALMSSFDDGAGSV